MGRIKRTGKIILAILFLGLLFFVVKYASTIRYVIAYYSAQEVAGAQTSLEEEIKQNIEEYSENTKNQLLNIKIIDLLNPVMRIRKISEDLNNSKEYIINEVGKIIKK